MNDDVALDDEIFWLKVHQMAGRLKARPLQRIAFQRLQNQFGGSDVPTSAFLLELYNDTNNSEYLELYRSSLRILYMQRQSGKVDVLVVRSGRPPFARVAGQ